jgi:large subunit ribosomal protein L17
MRHQLKGKKLNRTASHRKATLRSLAIALIKNERIVTTTVKAKELRRVIEPFITRAKEDTMHNRREVFSFLHDNESTSKLFNEIGPKCASRPGGYTRVIKLGTRQGDGAEIAVIELVDYNDVKPEGASTSTRKRTRRGGAKAKTDTVAPAAPKSTAAPAQDTPAVASEEVVQEAVAEELDTLETTTESVAQAEVQAEVEVAEAETVEASVEEAVAEVQETEAVETTEAEEHTEAVAQTEESEEPSSDDAEEEKKEE